MKNREDIVNIVYCCSDIFSEVCAVSIVSLLENNKHLNSINIFIIEDAISKENKNRIKALVERYDRKVFFISMPNPIIFFDDERFTIQNLGHTFSRLILGEILPENVDRVISLDCDTLVLNRIDELWNWDMREYPIAGVDDCLGKIASIKTQHLPSEDSIHCNAGMYLIDLQYWRKEKWTSLFKRYILEMMKKGMRLGGYEEEVIANVIGNRMLVLPPKYNLMTLEQVLSYDELMYFRNPARYYSRMQIEEAKNEPVITHTTNFFLVRKRVFEKNSDHPMHTNYVKYRNMTPWKDVPEVQYSMAIKNRLQKDLWHLFPRKVSIVLAKYARNYLRPLLQNRRDDE